MKRQSSLLLLLLITLGSKAQQQAIISGQIMHPVKDTVKIIILYSDITRQTATYDAPVHEGQFIQHVPITKATYITATDGTNYVRMLLQPGDSILFNYDAANMLNTLSFTGKGSAASAFLCDFARLKILDRMKEQTLIARKQLHPFDHMFSFIDSVEKVFTKQLQQSQYQISKEVYHLLEAQVKGFSMSYKYSSIGYIYHESPTTTLKKRQQELTPASISIINNLLKFDSRYATSEYYVNAVYSMLFMHYDALLLENAISNNLLQKYDWLNKQLPPGLRTPVRTLFLEHDMEMLNQAEDLEKLIDITYRSPADSVYKNYIVQRYVNVTSFKKGMQAPGFVLENETGDTVTLSSFRGKVVYLDFWYAACGPCIASFKNLASLKQRFAGNEVVFLNVSIDPKETWQNAIKRLNIDGYHVFTAGKGNQHPAIKAYKVSSYPTACLIDPQGNIFAAHPASNPSELEKQIEEALQTGKK